MSDNAKLPAYPTNREDHDGLTKREYLTGLAMQGHAANTSKRWTISELAKAAVETADALLSALEHSK